MLKTVTMTVINFLLTKLVGPRRQPKIAGKPGKIKIAIDQSVGRVKAEGLRRLGYDIVVVARDAEKDEEWMNKAFTSGAMFVISPDLDIPCLIEKENYPMIWIDYLFAKEGHLGKRNWVRYIDGRIKSKIRFFHAEFGAKL